MEDSMQNQSGGGQTGTPDTTYNLTAILYHALQGVENCRTYEQDAQGQQELAQFFRQAGEQQRQLAEQAKQLLHDQLMQGFAANRSAERDGRRQLRRLRDGRQLGVLIALPSPAA
jgi:hypothetical protein